MDKVLPAERWRQFPVLVAVSGGADSIALLRLLHWISNQVSGGTAGSPAVCVGHINHGLRGAESDVDERFVRTLAAELRLPFLVQRRVKVDEDRPSIASEENLRNDRYEALLALAQQSAARYIFTGHTLDDQAETILFRFLRGTGIAGLTGIPAIRVIDETISIVRPLLNVRRTELEELLEEFQQPYRSDSSNKSSIYTRNFLRNQLLPNIQTRFGMNVTESIVRLGRQAAETEQYLDAQARLLRSAIRTQSPHQVEIELSVLRQHPPLIQRQFFKQIWQQQHWPLQSMTFDRWQALAEHCASELFESITALNLPGGIRAEFHNQRVVLRSPTYEPC